jgi:hypothetical protein
MNSRDAALFFIIILITLTVSACATTEPPYRGKLSDAMEVASDDFKGERHLDVPESQPMLEPETEEPLNTELAVSSSTSVASNSQSESDDWKKNIMLSRGFGFVSGDYKDQHNWLIRMAGENNNMIQTGFYLGYEGVSLDAGSSLHQSVDGNLNILVAGVSLKRFFKPHSDKVRPYVSVGAGGAFMFWSYRNSFTISDGDTVSGDNLSGFTISTAAGIEFKPVPFLSIVLEANPKIHLWNERTGRGFDNDAFDPMGMIVFSVGVSLTQ